MIDCIDNTYSNGYLEKVSGKYEGKIKIDGIDLSPIEGVYFKYDEKYYLWLKRQDIIDYDMSKDEYVKRKAEPRWECYLSRQGNGIVAYKGEFVFCRFRYMINGIYDKLMTHKDRLNLYIERFPMSEQTIINSINKKNKEIYNGK